MRPDHSVHTRDGVRLGLACTQPPGPARADVLLLHAMLVDARSLDRPPGGGLASALAAAGFRVWRADLRGRGMSERPPDFGYDALVYQDLPALVQRVGGRPWVVGHSLGGHVGAAAWASGAVQLAGLVCLAANVWRPSLEPLWARRAAKAATLGAVAASLGLYGGMAARRFRIGSVDEPASYTRDLLRFWLQDRWADQSGRDWTVAARGLPGPVLSVLSRGDRLLGHPDAGRAWAQGLGTAPELWVLGDGDHGVARAPDHMGLATDPRSAPIWRAVGQWMAARS